MDDGFLPDYYIRKKQRDRMYTNVWIVLGGVLVICAAFFVGNFLWSSWGISLKKRGLPAVNEEQANELNKLQTESRINEAIATQDKAATVGDLHEEEMDSASPDAAGTPASSPGTADPAVMADLNLDLSEVEYSESFPLVTVALEAGDKKDNPNSSSQSDQAAAANDREPSTDSTAVSTGDPELDEAASNDPPPAKEDDEKEDESVLTSQTYHVYAAEVTSKEDAEKVVRKLAEHGYKGTIIDRTPYFLIKVSQTNKRDEALALIERLKQLGFEPIPTRSAN